jgi:hypothetical protein
MTETETDHKQILEFVQRCRDEHIAPYPNEPGRQGRYLINDAARLLAALRLSAQNQYRSDEVVREILETQTGGVDAVAASRTVTEIVRFPSGQLLAIASCALRAL